MLYIIQNPQKKNKLTPKKNGQRLHLLGDHLIKEAIMFHTQRLKKSSAKNFLRAGKRGVVLYIPTLPYPPPPPQKKKKKKTPPTPHHPHPPPHPPPPPQKKTKLTPKKNLGRGSPYWETNLFTPQPMSQGL